MTQQYNIVDARHLTRAGLAEALLFLEGRKYTLDKYRMFVSIYNSNYSRKVMRAGRQVSKTTVIAADIIMRIIEHPNTPALYCNSSADQTASFSRSKLEPFLKQSPAVHSYLFSSKDVIDNVFHKRFSNNSEIMMSYFSDSADRVRGRTGHALYLDEVQDMLYDAMIDAEECLSAAENPKVVYAGTSKSMITPLEYMWGESTQKHWVIPCSHCGKHNIPDKRNIGRKGLICKNCGGALNTYDGYWHAMGKTERPYADGYWIPQIIMPIHCTVESKWERLLEKLEIYPEAKFDNEVMGLPCGDGEQAISENDLKAICEDVPMENRRTLQNAKDAEFLAAGIDWGGGGAKNVSRTVLSIYAVYPDKPLYRKIYGKIYSEGEPVKHIRDIASTLCRFGVEVVCADHGLGNMAVSQLRDALSNSGSEVYSTIPIYPVMYSEASRPVSWNNEGRHYVVNRTNLIDNFLMDLKRGYIKAFRWGEFEPFARDILNVRQAVVGEDTGHPRRVWRHSPKDPDDSLHSMVFGWFAARVKTGNMDFIA